MIRVMAWGAVAVGQFDVDKRIGKRDIDFPLGEHVDVIVECVRKDLACWFHEYTPGHTDRAFGVGWQLMQAIYSVPAVMSIAPRRQTAGVIGMQLLPHCRARLPNECVQWLDALCAIRENRTLACNRLLRNRGQRRPPGIWLQLYAAARLPADQDKAQKSKGTTERILVCDARKQYARVKIGPFDPGRAGGYNQGMAVDWRKIAKTIFKYDVNSLLHHLFLANLEDGRVKIPIIVYEKRVMEKPITL